MLDVMNGMSLENEAWVDGDGWNGQQKKRMQYIEC